MVNPRFGLRRSNGRWFTSTLRREFGSRSKIPRLQPPREQSTVHFDVLPRKLRHPFQSSWIELDRCHRLSADLPLSKKRGGAVIQGGTPCQFQRRVLLSNG